MNVQPNEPTLPRPEVRLFHNLIDDYERYMSQGHEDVAIDVLNSLREALNRQVIAIEDAQREQEAD